MKRPRNPQDNPQPLTPDDSIGSSSNASHSKRTDLCCVLILLAVTLGVYGPGLLTGKVLLPADIVPLMRPWAATAKTRFPELRQAQNQMLGPIFEYYSWRHYARERVLQGEVPLWNPYELGGNVLLANSQSAVLYPPNLLLYVLPLWVGIDLVTVLHMFLTGCFMFWLLRRLLLGPPAALTGALIWMLCGLQVVWTEFQTPTAVLCWLPAALLAWEIFRANDNWRWAVFGGGGSICMALLAGHLQFAFYVILAFVLFAGLRTLMDCQREGGSISARSLGVLIGAVAFGIGLSAATMLPVAEMGRMNFRGANERYEGSIGLRLPPKNLFTLLMPDLYGNPRDYAGGVVAGEMVPGHAYFGAFDYIEFTAYVGVPALMLAAIACVGLPLLRRANNQDSASLSVPVPVFGVLAIVGLLLALGTPLCALFFYGVPGYRQFNATARALCLFSFGTAALAGFGLQMLLDNRTREGRRRIAGVAGWTAILVLAGGLAAFPGMSLFETVKDASGREIALMLTPLWFDYELASLTRFVLFFLLGAGAVWIALRPSSDRDRRIWFVPLVAAADLLVWGRGFNPATEPGMLGYPTETTDRLNGSGVDRVVSLEAPGRGLKSFIVPNYNAVVHVREAQGADSLHTRRYHRLLEQVVLQTDTARTQAFTDPNTLHVPNVNHRFFDLMNVRFITTDPSVQLGPPYRKIADAELSIWENPGAFGAAWIADHVEATPGDAGSAVKWMEEPSHDLKKTVIIAEPVSSRTESTGGATVVSFSPHRITYDVNQSGEGLLVTSEIYFPGWRASVDGRPASVLNVDWILRAASVPAGRHSVVFSYEPASFRVGVYISAVCAMAASAFFTCKRRPNKPI